MNGMIITKSGRKRGVCNFYYVSCPSALLGLILRQALNKESCEASETFSLMKDMIAITIGFDESDIDFIGTWRVCNWKSGNLSAFVQLFACIEGPVAKTYENEIRTIDNLQYPIRDMIQDCLDDHYTVLYCKIAVCGNVHVLFLNPCPMEKRGTFIQSEL